MKKMFVISLALIVMIFVISCGSSKETASTKSGSETVKKEEVKTEEIKKNLTVTIKIGDKELKYEVGGIRNNAMTPGQKSNDYTIFAGSEKDEKGNTKYTFNLDFTTEGSGEASDPYLTLKGYNIEKVSVNIENLETKKETYGGSVITSLKGSFTGQMKTTDANGFSTGDIINFTGTFSK